MRLARGWPSIAAEVQRYGAMQSHPQSIEHVLSFRSPEQLAEFLQREYPIRCAERLLMIEALPCWRDIPPLAEVHRRHLRGFEAVLSGASFPKAVDDIVSNNKDVVSLMAKSAHALAEKDAEVYTKAYVDSFLDRFLLNRIGSNVLLSHYLAMLDTRTVGAVDPQCHVTEICRDTVDEVRRICGHYDLESPYMNIETHDQTTEDLADLSFAFIPGIIGYILQELLKNSCRATLEVAPNDLASHPINVVICGDHKRVLIHVSDRAGGIPFDVGQHIWSYLYTTALKEKSFLAGYGMGLPLSRLYANYLGGSLDLVSLPGFGTHAYILFPRLNSELVETVPDQDRPWTRKSVFLQ